MSPDPAAHALDDPIFAALSSRHAHLGEHRGRVWRYQPDVAPFMSVPTDASEAEWADAAELLGPEGVAAISVFPQEPPAGWAQVRHLEVNQMVAQRPFGQADSETVVLGVDDVPAMLELVARTQPGPFGPRTIEMGTYLGIRDGDRLIAMAGERMSLPDWTEISAVCTDPDYRGRGLAGRVMAAVAQVIEARGDGIFLHVLAENTGAASVYERLGFTVRCAQNLDVVSPGSAAGGPHARAAA